jgi:MarR family transcriptional regulator, lower aerobic nicotinate degradation pathway regulator
MMARKRTKTTAAAEADRQVTAILNALRRLIRAARAAAQRAEQGVWISGAQQFVLEQLAQAPAPSLNDLAARTHTHKSSVSVVVSRLVARGLVRRRRSAGDRRGIELAISPAGRAVLRRVPQSAQARFLEALYELRASERAALEAGLERFTEVLGIRALAPTMLFESEKEAGRQVGPTAGSGASRSRP